MNRVSIFLLGLEASTLRVCNAVVRMKYLIKQNCEFPFSANLFFTVGTNNQFLKV